MKVYWQSANGVNKEICKLDHAHVFNILRSLSIEAQHTPFIKRSKIYKALVRRLKKFEGKNFKMGKE